MSIIAVHGFSYKYTLMDVIRTLAKPISGNFEALNFKVPKGQGKNKNKILKTCYLRLSEKLDPVRVVQQINDFQFRTKMQFKAHIPKEVPDFALSSKPKQLPIRLRMALRIPEENSREKVIQFTTDEIFMELQLKYPGLYNLSSRYEHKLLDDLSQIISQRVQEVADRSTDVDTCFKLTRTYRRMYPHSDDYKLVMDTHHKIQDAAGAPRTQLQEADLASVALPPNMFDMPISKLKQIRNKCADKIITRINDHVKGLECSVGPNDTEEEIARKQVRSELQKIAPFLQTIVNQMLDKHFMPRDGPMYRMRIYGEPFLPDKEVMAPFLSRFKPVHVLRSMRMFNLVKFSVPPMHYHSIMAMNGTVLNGAKLIIRSSDTAQYKGVDSAIEGGQPEQKEEEKGVPMDEDEEVEEDWDEEDLEL